MRWRGLGVVLMLGVIAGLTLTPTPPTAIPLPMFCLVCGDLGGVDVILNFALFVPLGIALVVAGLSWRRAVLVAALTTLGIESLQFSLIAGRDASISDLLTNTMGGAAGALLATHWRRVLTPPPATARWYAVIAALLAIGVMSATAALLQPTIPAMGLWGQWTPQQLRFEPYSGRVLSFHVNGIAVPYELVPESEPLRQRILTGETQAHLDFIAGRPTQRLSAIGRVGSRFQEVILLGATGTDFIFRTRLAVNDWRLRPPGIALPDAIPAEGENVFAEAGLRRHHWYAFVRSSVGEVWREVPFAISLGWTFILPRDRPLRPGDEWLSALWLAALAFPAALWGALSGRAPGLNGTFNGWWLFATGMILASMIAIPRAAHFDPASWIEWLGSGVGCMLGGAIAPSLRRLGLGSSHGMNTVAP